MIVYSPCKLHGLAICNYSGSVHVHVLGFDHRLRQINLNQVVNKFQSDCSSTIFAMSMGSTAQIANWAKNVSFENGTLTIILAAGVLALVFWQFLSGSTSGPKLPPGPRNLPIVGALFSVDVADVGQWYEKMAQEFGKIFYFRMGSHGMIVVCSAEGAEEVLKTKDALFANRPNKSFMKTAAQYIGFDREDLLYSSYNESFRTLKKLLISNFFTASKLAYYEDFRRREGALLVKDIQRKIDSGGTIEISAAVIEAALNSISTIVVGKRYSDLITSKTDQFKQIVRGATTLFSQLNLGDLFPWLAWTDFQGLQKEFKDYQQLCYTVFGEIIEEHKIKRKGTDHVDQDFVDLLLTFNEQGKITENGLMGCILDMVVGATDTNALTTEWALIELLRNPNTLAKLQKEIDDVVGKDRRVEESDFPNLPYLQAVINETFRLHAPAPVMVPHFTEVETTLQGFYVPANTAVLMNLKAIHRDPLYWKNPEKFEPERFLSSKMMNPAEGNIFTLFPFGSGRRKCPGANMGQLLVQRNLTTLLHAFDWSPPHGKTAADIDATEFVKGFVWPKTPLTLIARPRLALDVYSG